MAQGYWEKIEQGLRWPLTQLNVDTCTTGVLKIIAWQRDIDRFPTEPLWLFRLRVKYAFVNARDAGSIAGIKRIFSRLGIGYVEVEERVPGKDWDVIVLRLSDNQLSQSADLLRIMIEQYGRTCRRYEFSVITNIGVDIATIEFNNDWALDSAQY